MRWILTLVISLFYVQLTIANEYSFSNICLGSREADPESLIENVSAIYGDYSELEVDLIVPGPDPIILSRYYSSRDILSIATFGSWRLNPHCFLSLQKDLQGKSCVFVGTPEGSILKYTGTQNLFKLETLGIANTARGNIHAWTNLKNSKLNFDEKNNRFELFLNSGGKRTYEKHPRIDLYLLKLEILPSGNKIFYEYDDEAHLALITATNASEEKVFGWIKIHTDNEVHVNTSDLQTVDYHFEQNPSAGVLLTQVVRSHKPHLDYRYQIVDGHALLTKKELPEGRFTAIDYYTDGKIKSIATAMRTTTQFSYYLNPNGSGYTEVSSPSNATSLYQFDNQFQLTGLEQYLNGSLYRARNKSWGTNKDTTHLLSTSLQDALGQVLYTQTFSYDDLGNIHKIQETGDLTGAHTQDSHVKTYTHSTTDISDIFEQRDVKGNGVRYVYKKGTNLLTHKTIFEKNQRKRRHFYKYNEDAVLVQVITDDGDEAKASSLNNVHERHITFIYPKQNLPHVGTPEIVEEKYLDIKTRKEVLLKKTVNHFDDSGHVIYQDVFDAEGTLRYSLKNDYDPRGCLILQTDPMGKETKFDYDALFNLTYDGTYEYEYDLDGRLSRITEKGLETRITHEKNTRTSTDPWGNKTCYHYDDLNRLLSISYPEVMDEDKNRIHPTYTYAYNSLDQITSITDPKGYITLKSYNVRGQPTRIQYPDRSEEFFKYDPEGSLHRHRGRDGIVNVYEYDYLGRATHIERYPRGDEPEEKGATNRYYTYNAFHLNSEEDESKNTIEYAYDYAGRLFSVNDKGRKTNFFYDPLGRINTVKKWNANKYTLQITEYDLCDHIIEERTEDHKGSIQIKKNYVYNSNDDLEQIIGYPHNQKTILTRYEYDAFARPYKIVDALKHETIIAYDDAHHKRTLIDPLGNQIEEAFDPLNRLIKLTRKNKMDELLAQTEFFYDAASNKTLEKNTIIPSGKVHISEWTYGPLNRLESIIQEGRRTHFTYNTYGELTERLQPGADLPIEYKYNKKGRLQSISYRGGMPHEQLSYTLQHDKRGNITQFQLSPNLIITRLFNDHNQIENETIRDGLKDYDVVYEHDEHGRIDTIHPNCEAEFNYTYHGVFLEESTYLQQSPEYGELSEYTWRPLSYDLMGNLLEATLLEAKGKREQSWDASGRKMSSTSRFFQETASFDPIGNLKNKKTIIGNKQTNCTYAYNDLCQLISENEHTYNYDSLNNRLQKDAFHYKVDDLDQLLEDQGATYTYDARGNLTSKTSEGKTWLFRYNILNQLVQVETPDKTIASYTYDLEGRRLSKRVQTKDGKINVYRYLYCGQTEMGYINDKGALLSLRMPEDPNHPEIASALIQRGKKFYVPIADLQGNITALIDPYDEKIIESYHYSAFGEEEIFNAEGNLTHHSPVNNPWRFQGKRLDKETGLIYFGHRYYNPANGRWTTPDPAGDIDGPNPYAFVHNNPMAYVDYFGLSSESKASPEFNHYFYGEYEPPCHCEYHRDCKRGGDITNALSGVAHGIADFALGNLHELQTSAFHMGASDMDFTLQERSAMIHTIEQSQAHQTAAVEDALIEIFSIDPSDAIYQSSRSTTTLGLEVSSVIAGGYGVVKGIIGFTKLARMPVQASITARNLLKEISPINKGIKTRQIWTSTRKKTSVQNAFQHWKNHGHEFPELLNSKKYVEQTHNFFNSRDQFLTKMRPNGEILIYDAESNIFGAFTHEGIPKTMFKPTEGNLYWKRN